MRLGRPAALLIAILLLTGCHSSPPQRFYVLDPTQAPQASASKLQTPVQIASVNIPPSLDRQEMVRERAAGSLEISDVNRWGAPLGDMIQNVLTQDLMDRLPSAKVVPPRTSAPAATNEITVDILQFGSNSTGNVVLKGGWSLYHLGSDTPVFNRNVQFTEKATAGDYGAQARSMSRLLGRMADDIAESLRSGYTAR